ncbi:uncharacterized protein EDB91DRAFT_1085173 [Suillus paluster]|uniref:uncharacterized protein n=1 Tax=Suillus paluster TaxID=48578 RepID=UPI001B879E5F|nr:uncharacterized protein EDB91DRAFT_1085173 [Suillus paluster]KAG1731242.1 hypothetical protein EDB91DRAFT_1085173 [Suillus paluster]
MSLKSSSVVLRDKKHARVTLSTNHSKAFRFRRKIDRHITPLMCGSNSWTRQPWVLQPYLEFSKDCKSLNVNFSRYNRLGTVFYLSYLVFEYPQNLALQRFPAGKWMRTDAAGWSLVLMIMTSVMMLILAITFCNIYPSQTGSWA